MIDQMRYVRRLRLYTVVMPVAIAFVACLVLAVDIVSGEFFVALSMAPGFFALFLLTRVSASGFKTGWHAAVGQTLFVVGEHLPPGERAEIHSRLWIPPAPEAYAAYLFASGDAVRQLEDPTPEDILAVYDRLRAEMLPM